MSKELDIMRSGLVEMTSIALTTNVISLANAGNNPQAAFSDTCSAIMGLARSSGLTKPDCQKALDQAMKNLQDVGMNASFHNFDELFDGAFKQ